MSYSIFMADGDSIRRLCSDMRNVDAKMVATLISAGYPGRRLLVLDEMSGEAIFEVIDGACRDLSYQE